jgi:hypothetical protein
MSVRYAIDVKQRCVFLHLSGVIDDWSLGNAAQQLWDEQAFDPQYSRLVDGSDISAMRTDSNLVQAIAADVRSKQPDKVALVAVSEEVRSAFNLYKESLRQVSASVFSNVGEAIAWLGVNLPDRWPPVAVD